MSSIPPLHCGEALCKKPVSLPDGAVKPWPVQCGACGSYLYPGDVLESSRAANELEPQRADLLKLVDGMLVSCSTDDMQRWFQARQGAPKPAPPVIDLLDFVADAAPSPAARPPEPVHHPAPSAAAGPPGPSHQPAPRPPAQPGVACYRDGDMLLLLHMGETSVAFPDRCVVCNTPVRRAYLEHNQKSVFRENFYLQKTTLWIPGIRFYQERSIDVEYTMCDTHRKRRWLGLLWKAASVVAAVAPFVIFNLGLCSVRVLWVLWAVGWIGAVLLYRKGGRALSPMDLVEIGPTLARFRVGRPFLESFPDKAPPA